jgi:hypothetical protein
LLILSRGNYSLCLLAGVVTLAGTGFFVFRSMRGGAWKSLRSVKKQRPVTVPNSTTSEDDV